MKLSTKDVCTILKACKQYGVTEFVLGDLHLSLRPTANRLKADIPTAAIPAEEIQKNLDAENFSAEKEENAFLVIEDPQEMERRIANGELNEDEDTGY